MKIINNSPKFSAYLLSVFLVGGVVFGTYISFQAPEAEINIFKILTSVLWCTLFLFLRYFFNRARTAVFDSKTLWDAFIFFILSFIFLKFLKYELLISLGVSILFAIYLLLTINLFLKLKGKKIDLCGKDFNNKGFCIYNDDEVDANF